jgi:hypothetical protein
VTAEWAKLLARAVTAEQQAWAATVDDRRQRPRAWLLNEAPSVLLDGSRTYSLPKHPFRRARPVSAASGTVRPERPIRAKGGVRFE